MADNVNVGNPYVEISDLKKQLKEIGSRLEKTTKESAKQASSFKKIWETAIGVFGAQAALGAIKSFGRVFSSSIKKSIAASQKQESAVHAMNTQLALAGDYSREASRDIQNFASSLQTTTAVGDETTLQMFALAKTFGQSNEETKRMVTAATELSAATGLSLQGSIKNLGKTFAGLTGELGESIPALRELTPEALKSGKAVGLLLDKFGGSAAARLSTFEGQAESVAGHFGDLTEKLGDSITKNPIVIKLMALLGDTIKSAGDKIESSSRSIKAFVGDGILFFLKSVKGAVSGASAIFKGFANIHVGVESITASIVKAAIKVGKASGIIKESVADAALAVADEKILNAVSGYEKIDDSISSIEDTIDSFTGKASQMVEKIKMSGELATEAQKKLDELNNASGEAAKTNYLEDLANFISAQDAKVAYVAQTTGAISKLGRRLVEDGKINTKKGKKLVKAAQVADITANAVSGAVAAISGGIKAFGPIFGPIIGGIQAAAILALGVSSASKVKALNRGTDSVRGVGFTDSVPAMLTPGERVTPRESNQKLTRFLDRQDQMQSQPQAGGQIQIGFKGGIGSIADMLEAEFIERGRFQTGVAGTIS